MRVVAGSAKGRRLKGTISPGARPTTERVRAAIFNILDNAASRDGLPFRNNPSGHYKGRRVLDLYAGSGSLGIEALSRGAGWADFVERDQRQCRIVRANLETTGFSQAASVHCSAVEAALPGLPGPYGLVLLDPPYRLTTVGEVLEMLAAARVGLPSGEQSSGSGKYLVEPAGMVVIGHSKRLSLGPKYGPLVLMSQRRYGDNAVDFYQHGG